MKQELGYKNVFLLPQKSIVSSRRECDTSVQFGGHTFVMPVFPANMKSVVNENTCEFLASQGWFYTMHRFGTDTISFARRMKEKGLLISISTGIDLTDLIILKNHSDITPDYITIDVANAWSVLVEPLIGRIKDMFPGSFVIVGNVATAPAVWDLIKWGADALKVGIAGGHVCITKDKTGFHRPMISTLIDCACNTGNIPIIADGGISTHGDIAKALATCATMIMAGSLFSGYNESAGDIIEIDGRRYKEYFGSASEFNKVQQRNIEGKKVLIDYKGPMSPFLQELQEDLQSSISYAGGKDLTVFSNPHEFPPKMLIQVL
jgi:GMP reductase